ncbi:hypothetical protein [Cellulomonas oligotrophica]|uniref:Uncharacterized protein n=1 Tax=Cellulomonas oligotrophica TaxID=931536 RepID=A0A7Y9JZR9_9CELL|nr:hypothetical protein [Cellulomonas oligotrophica]NYD87109.1 hypothetical protein [Cellulomonas oligotrophica]GIG32105.1 hypothetical protein Col01nite_12640 [Cellulomonas oligotrophica]
MSVDVGVHRLRFASARLWAAVWWVFAAVVLLAVVDYVTMFLSAAVPTWAWVIPAEGLLLAAASVAVVVDVVAARRARGRRWWDTLADVVAAVLVGVWVALLWRVVAGGCLVEECAAVPVWARLFVVVPVVPLGGLTLIGALVRRGARERG